MKNERIYLSSPYMDYVAVSQVTEWINQQKQSPIALSLLELEKKINLYLGKEKYSLALNSGTSAVHLALIMLGIKPNDEVLCQSNTFSASSNPIKYLNAKPVFIDSEPNTWNICPNVLEDAIKDRIVKTGKKPKAIIPVHIYGMPYQVKDISLVAEKYEIPVIEDAAEALGSMYKGEKCGTFGDYSVLSFNTNKIVTTYGGGMLISNNLDNYKRALYLSTQAKENQIYYSHKEVGYNFRMNKIAGSIGCVQMNKIDDRLEDRRGIFNFYKNIFSRYNYITIQEEPSVDFYSNHWLSCILIGKNKEDKTSEGLRLALEKENIESRPLWKPMHTQPVYKNELYYGGSIAESLFQKGLCLPSGSNLSSNEKDRITRTITKYLDS
ncbi:MAG: DegT/DnrJ/EryC1/StrS family aminotransferase [Flavobacteriales bacterium]|nr:DegT/DnrJ/EryC1/StrS family aminotransferase [Flavobacteriales bacterium]